MVLDFKVNGKGLSGDKPFLILTEERDKITYLRIIQP